MGRKHGGGEIGLCVMGSFITCALISYYLDDQIEDDEVGGA
jgi:hypothetical protein